MINRYMIDKFGSDYSSKLYIYKNRDSRKYNLIVGVNVLSDDGSRLPAMDVIDNFSNGYDLVYFDIFYLEEL